MNTWDNSTFIVSVIRPLKELMKSIGPFWPEEENKFWKYYTIKLLSCRPSAHSPFSTWSFRILFLLRLLEAFWWKYLELYPLLLEPSHSGLLSLHYFIIFQSFLYLMDFFLCGCHGAGDYWSISSLARALHRFVCTWPNSSLFHLLNLSPKSCTFFTAPSISPTLLSQVFLITLVQSSLATQTTSNLNGFFLLLLTSLVLFIFRIMGMWYEYEIFQPEKQARPLLVQFSQFFSFWKKAQKRAYIYSI